MIQWIAGGGEVVGAGGGDTGDRTMSILDLALAGRVYWKTKSAGIVL